MAGLAGCALSLIGTVDPEVGKTYIVDSFMVVVLGGSRQNVGTVLASLGLGMSNKILEPLISRYGGRRLCESGNFAAGHLFSCSSGLQVSSRPKNAPQRP